MRVDHDDWDCHVACERPWALENSPHVIADPSSIIGAKIPSDIREKYEVLSYRNAAVILSESCRSEFEDLLGVLRSFQITSNMIRTAGGNESNIPKLITAALRPQGWYETDVEGDLVVRLKRRKPAGVSRTGKPLLKYESREIKRPNYLGGHKVDFLKNRVAFEIEWNSKDQTFDRDLYAFESFFRGGVIDVGVVVTRGESLNPALRLLGQSLKKDGRPEFKMVNGKTLPRLTHQKYGASTTWWGKLIYR